jgi:D-sedoheptulose 7-phosphate isomerase
MNEVIKTRISEISIALERVLADCADSIEKSALLISQCFAQGGKILICGNGGSAADSQHFAGEFVSSFAKDLDRKALPAIALTVDTSIITAISNDKSFEMVFSRQVEAIGRTGDVLIVLTTSGSSRNCLEAVSKAKELGLKTIAFTKLGGDIAKIVDSAIEIPSENTQHIQECHMVSYHILTELVENTLFRGDM